MTISAACVLFAVIWFLVLFIILPLKLVSQSETGHITSGTPPSAPENPNLKRKIILTTFIAFIVWSPLCVIIVFELITMKDLDFYGFLD